MVRKPATSPPTSSDASDKVEELLDAVAGLTDEVKSLASQVEVLRIAIDDARAEFEWAVRNHRVQLPPQPYLPVTSVAKDPLAEDIAVNRVSPADVAALRAEAAKDPTSPLHEADLFN